MQFAFVFVGVVGDDVVCDNCIFTYQRTSYVFHFLSSKGVLSELKMVTYFFVKSAEQS